MMVGNINNKNYKMILDTGSELNLISENIINELKDSQEQHTLPTGKIIIQTVIGRKKLTSHKQIYLKIFINENRFITSSFIIMKDLPENTIILGTPILNKYNTVINLEENKIIFKIKNIC